MARTIHIGSDDRDEAEINLTPMLDVVFIMLIFFIVTASFIRETGLEANRSEDSLEPQPESEAILLTIESGDEIRIDGLAVDPRAIRAHLTRLHAQNPDWPVVIDARPASTTKMLVAALDAARMSKIENVSIASRP